MNPELLRLRLNEGLIRGLIWAMGGSVFALSYLGFSEYFRVNPGFAGEMFPAAGLAGGLAALIYGSMRLAVITAALIGVGSVALLIALQPLTNPMDLLLPAMAGGLVIGGLYGFLATQSRVYMADAKGLAGAFAGMFAAALLMLWGQVGAMPGPALTIALLCPITGWMYMVLLPHFVPHFQHTIPPAADGALAGMAVAVFVAYGLWFLLGVVEGNLTGQAQLVATGMSAHLASGVGAGLLSGAVGGFVSGMMGIEWRDP